MTGVPVTLAGVLSARYSLERELARGGMATVYVARDLRDGQAVAVKVMHPALASAVGRERFLREIALARQMSHPRIVPLLESGHAGDLLYYVMPYVDGEPLSSCLERERSLGLERSVQLTLDVASALGYAHSLGVLHRDVKPENILLTSGHALVADFGLARTIGAADSQKLTATGIIVGTLHYMSPEQLLEDPGLDQRADIYALGCELYEMLTGGPPFPSGTLTEVAARILRAPVPSVARARPDVPPSVERALARSLAKVPAERFATMEEFAAALTTLLPQASASVFSPNET